MSNLGEVAAMLNVFHPGMPAIVLGDFNVSRDEVEEMLGKFPGFLDCHAGLTGRTYTCDPEVSSMARRFNEGDRPERFDYILASAAHWTLEEASILTDWIWTHGDTTEDCSDHLPVQAILRPKKG